jgi:hypothetical protein
MGKALEYIRDKGLEDDYNNWLANEDEKDEL